MTLLGALVVLLHLRRRNLDFLQTYIHTYIPDVFSRVKVVNNALTARAAPRTRWTIAPQTP